MIGRSRPFSTRSRAFALTVLIAALGTAPAHGHESGESEERLVERVTESVMRQLADSDFIATQMRLVMERDMKKRRDDELAARAEQERVAAEKASQVRRVSASRDHVFGNPDADVTLIEYSDFECPYCKRFHATPREVVAAYDGRVNWVYRHYPLGFHNPGAQEQAEASECAAGLGGNDAFWAYADALYARTTSNGEGFPLDGLVPLAEELGLDGAAFQDCLASDRYAGRVEEDLTEGADIGIRGTPGIILLHNASGAVRVVPGAVPLARLKTEVDLLLDSSGETPQDAKL